MCGGVKRVSAPWPHGVWVVGPAAGLGSPAGHSEEGDCKCWRMNFFVCVEQSPS